MAYSQNPRNEIWIHNENGIARISINGVDLAGLKDYSVKTSANGMTEVMILLEGESHITEFEANLTKSQQ